MRKMRCVPLLATVVLAACSGVVVVTNSPFNTVPVIVTLQDTPPTGVTVVSFVLHITGMSLRSSTPSVGEVALLQKPIDVQLQGLQTLNEFLTKAQVPSGTFTSLTMTFGASADMTIVNGSVSQVSVGSVICAIGQVCQVQPALNVSSITIASSPFPAVLTGSTPVSIALNFNSQVSIQGDLSVTPTVTATASTSALASGSLVEVSGMNGVISSVGNNQFTVMDTNTGNFVPMNVNPGITGFHNFFTCQQGDFTCLQTGQNVNVPFAIAENMSQVFTASSVGLVSVFTQGFDGIITAISPGQNQFQMVVNGVSPMLNGTNVTVISVGEPVLVTVDPAAAFHVANGAVTIPASLMFRAFSDLAVGQHVFINAASIGSGVPAVITADQIVLSNGQFTANIAAIASPNLTISSLNNVFTGGGVTQMSVQTSAQTQFANLTNGFESIGVNNTLHFGGLLFNDPSGGRVLVAQQVAGPAATPIVETSTSHTP